MAAAKSLDLQPLVASVLSRNSEVLNAANPEVLSLVLAGGADAALRSDCDEQFLLFVPFATPVKLHTLQFTAQEGASPCAARAHSDGATHPRAPNPAPLHPVPPRRLPQDAQALREPDVHDV